MFSFMDDNFALFLSCLNDKTRIFAMDFRISIKVYDTRFDNVTRLGIELVPLREWLLAKRECRDTSKYDKHLLT